MKYWIIGSLKSKTVHFFTWAAAVVPTIAAFWPEIQSSLPQLRGYIPEDVYKAAFVVLVVGGVILRLITTKPVILK